jgi:hypothetical protein
MKSGLNKFKACRGLNKTRIFVLSLGSALKDFLFAKIFNGKQGGFQEVC